MRVREMNLSKTLAKFLSCESGAVTVDWFALTLGAIGLSLGVVNLVAEGQLSFSDWVVAQLETAANH